MVIGQMGQSLDGRIATRSGHSHYVTGPEDIRRLHRVRALVDAVVVGAGTVASDDPRLTVREVEGPDPVRVILDPRGRLSPKHRVFTDGIASDGASRTLVVQRERQGRHGTEAWEGGERLFLPTEGPLGFPPGEVVALLADRGLHRVLVEGGGVTVSRFLQAGALDRLHITVAPLLIGSGRPGISLDPIETLDEALRPACRTFTLGKDTLFDLDLRAP
jgi:diaminohydroxyphosphoribosylaminopyrimidine deaminase / 5-amino-6-(5-phosphoribosylamino)uracil reductase